MANTWRILDGALYASKAPTASDANAGTMELPKLTAVGLGTGTTKKVLGNAIWLESPTSGNMHADQMAIMDGVTKTTTTGNVAGGFSGLTYKRYSRVTPSSGNNNRNNRYVDNINVGYFSTNGNHGFQDCLFIGNTSVCSNPGQSASAAYYQRCVVVGKEDLSSSIYLRSTVNLYSENTHFDENVNIIYSTNSSANNLINNCNFAGNRPNYINIDGAFYNNLADAKAAKPALFVNCTSYTTAQCKFNNPDYMDFSLKPDSPLIGAGTNGSNITGQPRAQIYSHLSEIIANGTLVNLYIDPVSGEWFVGNNGPVGVLTGAIDRAGRTRQMDILDIIGMPDLIHNVPSVSNNLVNHNLLTMEWRWANGQNSILDAPWKPFRFGVAPSVNADGTSNGEQNYNWNDNIPILYSERQPRITLRNNFIQQ